MNTQRDTDKTDTLQNVRETKQLLDEWDLLGRPSARARVLLDKLESERINVAVIGQFKRGKSALVNALLAEPLLPVGIIPVTSAVTEIRYGQELQVDILFRNGLVSSVGLDELPRYISEEENPDNEADVSSVRLQTPSPFLEGGLTLVDTPGVGSFHRHNTEAAYAFVRESDAVIFMLSVDTPINEIEIEFLRNTRAYAGKFFFVINKIDLVGAEDLAAFVAYCDRLLKKLMEMEDITLFTVSAREGTGIDDLREGLLEECRGGLMRILCESTERKLYHIIVEALAQIDLYWKVLVMTPLMLKRTIARMESELAAFRERADETVRRLVIDETVIVPGLKELLDAEMNTFKLDLTDTVTSVFGMDYHYEIEELRVDERLENPLDDHRALAGDLGKKFAEAAYALVDELGTMLQRVLLYRNESTPEVVTHIYALNRTTRQLRRKRDALARTQ